MEKIFIFSKYYSPIILSNIIYIEPYYINSLITSITNIRESNIKLTCTSTSGYDIYLMNFIDNLYSNKIPDNLNYISFIEQD